MIQTPFDNITIKLFERSFSGRIPKNSKLTHCITFTQVCRVKYIQMYGLAKRTWEKHQEMLNPKSIKKGIKSLSTREMTNTSLESIEAKVNYFCFIEELNRFGRFLKNKYNALIPDFYRLKFYRDKMIEHWDDYERYLNTTGTGYTCTINKLVIPFHFGAINTPSTYPDVFRELKGEFSKYQIYLPQIDLSLGNQKYTEIIYSYLEKIDQKLIKIPESIITVLIIFSFPVPINDIEEYINRLITWLDNFSNEGF